MLAVCFLRVMAVWFVYLDPSVFGFFVEGGMSAFGLCMLCVGCVICRLRLLSVSVRCYLNAHEWASELLGTHC